MLRRTRDIVGNLLGGTRGDEVQDLRTRVEKMAGELDILAKRLQDRELRLEDAQCLNKALVSMKTPGSLMPGPYFIQGLQHAL